MSLKRDVPAILSSFKGGGGGENHKIPGPAFHQQER